MDFLNRLANFVWGPYFLVPILLIVSIYLTIILKGIQFKKLFYALYLAFIVRKEKDVRGDISHFQALMTALSATVGTGNIVGVATAIASGGPGALFWMWITGLFGMASKYSEALLAVKFRIINDKGQQSGGPMYYLSLGFKHYKKLGQVLGFCFALFAAIAAFGMGNMVQSNSIADSFYQAFAVPHWVSGAVIVIVLFLVTIGGIKSIGKFTSFFVPIMIMIYVLSATIILVIYADHIINALLLIIKSAFTTTAAQGGFIGAGVNQAIRYGIARGIFSNESGLGSAAIAAASAQSKHPVSQALVSMTQTFIDTILICTMTGLIIIVTDSWQTGINGVKLSQLAFTIGFAKLSFIAIDNLANIIIAVCLSMFAFSTLLGWGFYAEKSIEYLIGTKFIIVYRLIFIFVAFLGSIYSLNFVWIISDIMNGLMAIPNLIGLLLLSPIIVKETKNYFYSIKS